MTDSRTAHILVSTDDSSHDTIRVRSTFSRTLKGGWSDESTIELTVNPNGPNGEWSRLFRQTLDTLAAITQAECDRRNQRDSIKEVN